MRKSRVKLGRPGYYHCISRTVNREFLLGKAEKEYFVQQLRRIADFCGVTVVTYVVMSNHFHILLAENELEDLDDEALLARLKAYYRDNGTYKEIEQFLLQLRTDGLDDAAEEFRQKFLVRMHDVSEFMKTLKQCFAQWYNRKHTRCGPFWSDRFKSVLVEPGSDALRSMASYIDLNPVRAGLVGDAKDYRFSGYGSALGGELSSQDGLVRLFESDGSLAVSTGPWREGLSWENVAARYRMLVFCRGVRRSDRSGKTTKPGHTAAEIRAVYESSGKLSLLSLTHCRVRYFSEGVVLGSRSFVEELEPEIRKQLKLKRARAAKAIRECSEGGLHVFRRFGALQVTPPG